MEKCVLICDDDIDILDICRMILESEGLKVITCSTAESLHSNLALHKPNLIFIDNSLVGITGKELISNLKGKEAYKAIPVLLFSANSEIEEMAKNASADGYLAKPFNISDLKTTVDTYLN
jgi:two-component system cell cycle response regulator DivK